MKKTRHLHFLFSLTLYTARVLKNCFEEGRFVFVLTLLSTFWKSERCLRTPIRTSSRSFKNPRKMWTRSAAANWSLSIIASLWMKKARVRCTFHWGAQQTHEPQKASTVDVIKGVSGVSGAKLMLPGVSYSKLHFLRNQ